MFDLKGKVALVTGASGGLGKDAALAYAKAGANVILLAKRMDRLEAVAKEIEAMGVKALPIQVDVTNEENVKMAIDKAVEVFGRIDILLNNAGIAIGGAVDTMSAEDWDRAFDINVKGIFLVSKYVIPVMKKNNYGKVTNVSSINAFVNDKIDMFVRHSYIASKASVLGLTRAMAASYAQFNITVNAVCPGLFESEMTANTLFKSDAFMSSYNDRNPSGRPGKHGELNGPILFFSSDASSYVTGQYMLVDGGLRLV